ncbi:nuclear factor of activated T-cells 5-like isoform X6 [Osmia bicornis bicornis]|uniref:nuclear factor of activated T-cells 5-like isoform X6 n=1 Tax=Osmia bicornis bicornis TaxID=1437191 RepID=UPI001EAEB865|nr:nuclear factor of activated T-cells 5-like isoform X6 [Osmia bicornis bicornis]
MQQGLCWVLFRQNGIQRKYCNGGAALRHLPLTFGEPRQSLTQNEHPLFFTTERNLNCSQRTLQNMAWNGAGEEDSKRRKMDIKLESEDANFAFPEVTHSASSDSKTANRNSSNGIAVLATISGNRTGNGSSGRVVEVSRSRPGLGVLAKRSSAPHQGPVTLTSQLCSASSDGKVQLQIICQPEQQHRARYQTEGSRGAVKDRTGNGFPIVRLVGYDKPTTLQVFIGTDLGRVAPHMFYQACRVSGKNSTPCIERKIDGTIVIEVDMDPAKDMMVTCDCVGILKERNVDVEHRFPQEAGVLQGRSKKKSTRCRMVFRTTIARPDGNTETLQVCSQPIVCTQPPGIPEICKKSLTSCPCTGGLELFILGKNFLKDTRVVFQLDNDDLSSSLEPHWECAVLPDKEFLQQTHLVCVVPAYRRQDLAPSESVSVKLYAVSSGKTSEPHTFLYTAASAAPEPSVGKIEPITPPLSTSNGDSALATSPAAAVSLTTGVSSNTLITQAAAGTPNFLTTIQSQQSSSQTTETLKSDPSPPPVTASSQVTPVLMWAAQSPNCQNSPPDVMMPPPAMVANPLLNRRSSSNLQLILPDNLKTEVLDENSENSMISENSMQSIPTPTANGSTGTSPLQQLVNENSRETPQTNMIRSVPVAANNSPVQEAVNLLGVVDLMRNQHPLSMVSTHQNSYGGMHESSQVKVLSPHHINKETNPMLPAEGSPNGTLQGGGGVVDLRMKHHQSEFGNLSNFTGTSNGQLPAQSGHSVEKYLNHIESNGKEAESQENGFVGSIQQRASIIATGRQPQQGQASNILASPNQGVKLDTLVNSGAESHQLVSPLRTVNPNSSTMMSHVSAVTDHETIPSPQQSRNSPPIPVKTMLLEALMPAQSVPPLIGNGGTTVSSPASVVQEPTNGDSLLTTINAALLPAMQEPVVTTSGTSNSSVTVPSHNQMQVTNETMSIAAEHIPQIQGLIQQEVVAMQQAQQVEQVVAQAQQQVEQVVAQAQQQAVQAVQQAQQQVVQHVVQHAQVVQQAVQQVQAAQQVRAVPAVQHAMQQATQEVVQQAVQQATQEVVQQVQAVQQAVQQAQAAQAMQQAVQQDIGSMLNQPAGFVAEASSALASGAAQEPSQQRLTTAAEQAINNVITNATQDIINNRPITTTTAHAIIATKNILNSVATQSAQLMNSAMEGILPKSPPGQNNIVEQVASKSPPVALPVTPNRQNVNPPITNTANNTTGTTVRKQEDGMLPQELTSMSEHDLLSYINPSCFDSQNNFLM